MQMTLLTTEINYPSDSLRQVVTYYHNGTEDVIISTTLIHKVTGEVLGFVGSRPNDR